MAAQYKAGTFTSPTSTGNQATTGVGFQPKAVIFIFEKQTSAGSGTDYLHGMGFGISSSSRLAISCVYLDNVAGGTAKGARAQSNAHAIYAYNTTTAATSAFLVADVVSLDSDGFTLNFTTVQASGYLVSYIAIGGADVSNVALKQLQAPAGTGSQAYTGVGFKSDVIITISNTDTSTGPGNSFNAGAVAAMGFGTAAAHKASSGGGDETAGAFSAKAQKTDVTLTVNPVSANVRFEATLTSFDTDGFTWNWTTTSVNRYVHVLCIKGGQYKLGTFNQATSTGNQSVSGAGFAALGVMLASVDAASSTSVASNNDFSLGGASSSSSRWATWLGSSGDPTVVDHYHDDSNVLRMLTEGTPTAVTTADYVSNDSDGFTINNTTVDATGREVVYLIFGSNATTAVTPRLLMMMGMGY